MSTVIDRLMGYTPNGEMDARDYFALGRHVVEMQAAGWTDDEIVSKLKWMEEVNPDTAEDVALRKMKEVDERVAARLASTKS